MTSASSEPVWLAFKTTDRTSVAFKCGRGGRLIGSRTFEMEVAAEDHLLLLDQFLRSLKLQLHDLDFLVVVKGPGSFTSVRIGVAIANALSFACSLPLVAIHEKAWATLEQAPAVHRRPARKHASSVRPVYSSSPNITFKKKI